MKKNSLYFTFPTKFVGKVKILCLITLCTLHAQNVPTFNKVYNLPNSFSNISTSVMTCNGGYIVYGEEIDSAHFYKVVIMKLDSTGNLIWSKSYGRNDSNYASIFTFGGGGVSVPWGGYAGVGFVFNDTGTWGTWDRLALYRFDNNGDTVWTKIYNDTANIEGWFLKVARNNKYILASNWFVQKTNYFYTPALTLTDSLGNKIWQKTYHAAPNHVRFTLGIDTCKDGGFVICGADYDTNYPAQIAENIFIIKTDTAGNPQWTKFISPPFYGMRGYHILSLKNGGYIICGEQGTKNNWPDNYPLLYMARINDTGTIIWTNTYGPAPPPESGYDDLLMTRELSDGNIIACGNVTDPLLDTMRGCILKVDSNGNQIWLRFYYMKSPSEQDYLCDINPTIDRGYVTCGFIDGSILNTWVIKTDSLGCDSGCNNNTGTEELRTKSEEVRVFPNPNNGQFTIQCSVLSGQWSVEVYNVLGEQVTPTLLPQSRGGVSFSYQINISSQPSGVYFYRVLKENGSVVGSGKLIIEK